MCKSRMEGGQRCASHARKALDTATAAMNDANNALVDARLNNADPATVDRLTKAAVAAVEAQDRAEVEFASTPTGRRFFTDKIAQNHTNPIRHSVAARRSVGEWHTTIAKGDLLREQNKAAASAGRLNQHPRALEAAAEIAEAKYEEGLAGWAGANRVMARLGLQNVNDDPYLASAVAEQFGFEANLFGKGEAPVNPDAQSPVRLDPAPMNATDFEVMYQPVRRDDRAADYVYFGTNAVRSTEQVKTLWSVQDHPDGTVTYLPGVVAAPGVHSYVTTRKPWTTGLEQVNATSDDLWQSPLDRVR